MNGIDIAIIIVLAVVIALIVIKIIKDRRKGKSCCQCGCQSCSGCDSIKRDKG